MTGVSALDAGGKIVSLWLCPACIHPRITYIMAQQHGFNAADVLIAALAIVVIAVGILFGMVVGEGVGVAVLIACGLVGAGILAAEAASKCG
jgi:hypothetical protein